MAQLFVATVLGGSAIWFQCDWLPAVPALGHWPMCAHGWVHNSAAAASMLRLRHYQQLLRLVVGVVDAASGPNRQCHPPKSTTIRGRRWVAVVLVVVVALAGSLLRNHHPPLPDTVAGRCADLAEALDKTV